MNELAARNENIMLDLIFGRRGLQECCDLHGITMQTLRYLRKSPMWKKRERELLDERKTEYEVELNAMVQPAMEGLKEMAQKTIEVPSISGEGTELTVNPPHIRLGAVKEILAMGGVGQQDDRGPSQININMYVPPHMRKAGEEDKETVTITINKEDK